MNSAEKIAGKEALQADADVAEFLCHNAPFREAFYRSGLDLRKQILAILYGNNNNQIDRLLALEGGWPVIDKIVTFLRLRILKQINKQRPDSKEPISAVPMTPEERFQKAQAKTLYDAEKYQEAVEMALELIARNPHLEQDDGIIGFIMNCYNRSNDAQKALKYALLNLKLEEEKTTGAGIATVGIAMYWAKYLGEYELVLMLAKKYPKYLSNYPLSRVAAKSAYYLGRYEDVVKFADNCEPHLVTGTVLDMAIESAFRVGNYIDVIKFARLYYSIWKLPLSTLRMVVLSARKFGDSDTEQMYSKAYDKKLISAEHPDMPSITDET